MDVLFIRLLSADVSLASHSRGTQFAGYSGDRLTKTILQRSSLAVANQCVGVHIVQVRQCQRRHPKCLVPVSNGDHRTGLRANSHTEA